MSISQCNYKINGSESFSFEKIVEHYYKTTSTLKNSNIFSSDEIVQSTVTMIKNQLDLKDDIINNVRTDKAGNKIALPLIKAVSDFITANNLQIFQKIGLKNQEKLSPEYIKENRILNFIKLNLDAEGIITKAEDTLQDLLNNYSERTNFFLQEILAEIEVEEKTKNLGIALHKTLSKVIYDEGNIDGYTKAQLKASLADMSEHLEGDIDAWVNKLMDIIDQIYKKVGSRGRVLSEVWLRSEEESLAQVKGAIDIVVVDDEGNAHIYDLKISKGSYKNWDSAKKLTSDWQLAFYRALLGQYIPVKNTELNIIPLVVGKVDANSKLNINNVRLDSIINRLSDESGKPLMIVSKDLTEDYVPGKLTSGKMYLIARKLIPEEKKLSYDPKRSDDILRDINLLFPEYKLNLSKSKLIFEEELQKAVRRGGFHSIYPDFVHESVKIQNGWVRFELFKNGIAKTNNELISEYSDVVQKYVNFVNNAEHEIISSLRNKITDAINNNTPNKIEMSSPEESIFIRNFITKFLGDWKVIKNSEELDSLGFILMQNKSNGNYALISITANNMLSSYDNEYSWGDVELIKSMIFLNHLYDELELDVNHIEYIETINIKNTAAPARFNEFIWEKYEKLVNANKIPNNRLKWKNMVTFENRAKTIINKEQRKAIVDLPESEKIILNEILTKYDQSIGDLEVFHLKQIIKDFIKKYPHLAKKSFETGFDFNNPIETLFAYTQILLLAKSEIIPIGDYFGINNYNLHASNFKAFLSGIFSKNIQEYDKNERRWGSIIEGLKTITPDKVKSRDLQAINRIINGTNSRIGIRFDHESVIINNLTKKFYKDTNYNVASQTIANHRKQFRNLWLTGDDGKISKEWKVKNPYIFDQENAMTDSEREYLKQLLFRIYINTTNLTQEEINKIDISTAESLQKTAPDDLKLKIERGIYFEMPIIRSQQWDRYGAIYKEGWKGVKEMFKSWGHEIHDYIDSRELTPEEIKSLKGDIGYYEMYDVYSRQSRTFIQDKIDEKGEEYWELDLDAIAHRVIFSKIRKKYLDNILPVINAYTWYIKEHSGRQNKEITQELEYIANRLKVASLDEHIVTKDAEDVVKIASAVKSITTKAMLAFRPALFLKEITIGLYKNYSLAITQMAGKDQFAFKDLNSAFKKLITIDNKFSAEWNLIDSLNKKYRFANLDINTLSKRYRSNRKVGLHTGFGKWMFAMNTIPDYYNRLSLFLAKMIHDGSYDAHTMDEDGFLKYDPTKDKRFEHYFKNRENHKNDKGDYIPAKDDKEYNKQRNLYLVVQHQFNIERKLQNESELKESDFIPEAYTNKERDSYKSFTDTVYGYYDKDAQAEIHHTWFGIMYLQFMQFWPAKMSLWFGTKYDKNLTPIGKFEHKKNENGQLLYKKYLSEDYSDAAMEFTTEDTGDPVLEWQGSPHEGLFFAITETLRDVVTFNWSDIKNKDDRTRRALYGIMEGFMMIILFKIIHSIIKAWISENGTEGLSGETMSFVSAVAQKVSNEADLLDNTFGALRSTPAFWSYTQRASSDLFDIVTGSNTKSGQVLAARNFRALEFWDER